MNALRPIAPHLVIGQLLRNTRVTINGVGAKLVRGDVLQKGTFGCFDHLKNTTLDWAEIAVMGTLILSLE